MRVCHNLSASFDDPNLVSCAGLVPVSRVRLSPEISRAWRAGEVKSAPDLGEYGLSRTNSHQFEEHLPSDEHYREDVPRSVELRWRSWWSSCGDHGFIMTDEVVPGLVDFEVAVPRLTAAVG